MAWGECFTRSAVACEFFVFADFANSSRRRLLRPAVGFMDNRGSVRNRVYALIVAPTVIYMLILVASLAASVRSLRQRPFLPRDGNPDVCPLAPRRRSFQSVPCECRHRCRPHMVLECASNICRGIRGGFVVEILREPSK